MTYQVSAQKDPMAAKFEAAGLQGRGFQPLYRVTGSQWKLCRTNRGAEGMVALWYATADEAKEAARAWLRKNIQRKAA